MRDTRSELREAFSEILTAHYADFPDGGSASVPIGKLADAAHNLLTDVPALPPHDEQSPRVFTSRLTTYDPGSDNEIIGHDSVCVRAPEPVEIVRVEVVRHDGQRVQVNLPPKDAEDLFLAGLAAVRHVQERP